MAEVLNLLGQTVLPTIFNSLAGAGIGETVTIKRRDEDKDGSGNLTEVWSDEYTDVLVPPIKVKKQGYKRNSADQLKSVSFYEVTIPANQNGELLDVKTNDRIIVAARGTEPEKIYLIRNIDDVAGVVRIATCTREN